MRRTLPVVIGLALLAAMPAALASVHLMQIEQVVATGANAHAVQLRMRFDFQNQMQFASLRAWSADGSSVTTIATFAAPLAASAGGTRILIATPAFAAANPGITPDYTMQPIPVGAQGAGRITFEDGSGVLWSLCWGGGSYTGPTNGTVTNDGDGNFGPCVASALPLDGRGIRFQNAFGASSTNNLADYQLTAGAATVTNSAGRSVVVVDVFGDGFESASSFAAAMAAQAAKAAATAPTAPPHAHDHPEGFVPGPGEQD